MTNWIETDAAPGPSLGSNEKVVTKCRMHVFSYLTHTAAPQKLT